MNMRLGAVAGVPTTAEHIADPHALPRSNLDTALLKMAEGNQDIAALDQYMIPGKRYPTCLGSSLLGERVSDRR